MSNPARPVDLSIGLGPFITEWGALLQRKADKTGGVVPDAGTNRRVGAVYGDFLDDTILNLVENWGVFTTLTVQDNITIGDGTDSPTLVFNRDAAGESGVLFLDAGVLSWAITDSSTNNLIISKAGNVKVLEIDQVTSLASWKAGMELDSANPDLTVGDGLGQPDIVLNQVGTGLGSIVWQTAGVASWRMVNNSIEQFRLDNGAGQNALGILQSGDASFGFDLTLVNPAAVLVVGNWAGAPAIHIRKDGGTTGQFVFSTDGSQSWAWINDASEDYKLDKAGAVNVLTISQSTSLVSWAASMDLDSASPDLTVGDASGSPRFILDKDETGISQVIWRKEGSQSWALENDASENLIMRNAGGSASWTITQSSGLVNFLNSVKVTVNLEIDGALNHDGGTAGFFNTTPIAKPAVSGSWGGNAAGANLAAAMASLGLITDNTTA